MNIKWLQKVPDLIDSLLKNRFSKSLAVLRIKLHVAENLRNSLGNAYSRLYLITGC